MKTPRTWILIADGARARLVSAERHGQNIQIAEKFEFHAGHEPNRELLRDKPARVFESNGATRHAVERKTDPHRALKHDFAETLAEALKDHLANKLFDRLVVVAPPVTLGDLRAVLSDPVKAVVTAELTMDLTKTPNSEIADHIDAAVVI